MARKPYEGKTRDNLIIILLALPLFCIPEVGAGVYPVRNTFSNEPRMGFKAPSETRGKLQRAELSNGVYIDINVPSIRRLPIAVPELKDLGSTGPSAEVAKGLYDTLIQDLDISGLFDILDKRGYIEDPQKVEIDFGAWRAIGSELLIKGGFTLKGEELLVEVKLYDVLQERMILGRQYTSKGDGFRRIIHRFANEVVEALTGEKGIFETKLLFVSDTTGSKEVYISDYDGYNPREVTRNGSINLSPQWSPDGSKILYTSYKEGRPILYMLELATTGKEKRVSDHPGINIGARWSPTGKEIALTLSKDGNPELYILTLEGMALRRLTNNWGIDVSPTWSPDGRQIAFVSDVAGNPHIYVVNSDGTGLRRLTYEGKYNASPTWSPKGDKIAFTRMEGGRFDIWVMNPDGSHEIQLTSGPGNNEDPSWAPNGRFIAFNSTTGGTTALYIIGASGEGQRMLFKGKGNLKGPAWSPYLSR